MNVDQFLDEFVNPENGLIACMCTEHLGQIIHQDEETGGYWIECSACGRKSCATHDLESAKALWNYDGQHPIDLEAYAKLCASQNG